MSEGTRESHVRVLKKLSAMLDELPDKKKREPSEYLEQKLAETFPRGYVARSRIKIAKLEAKVRELEGREKDGSNNLDKPKPPPRRDRNDR